MNSDIIPQGSRQLITGSASVVSNLLQFRALTACALTSIVFKYPAKAHAQNVAAVTLAAGDSLYYIKSMTVTSGTAELVELGNA